MPCKLLDPDGRPGGGLPTLGKNMTRMIGVFDSTDQPNAAE